MKQYKSFLPNGRWLGGIVLVIFAYIAFTFFSPVIDVELETAAEGAPGYNQYVGTIIENVQNNFWFGVLILMGGGLFYIIMSGLPGQTEERWQRWV